MKSKDTPQRRANIPHWLADPDGVAPCLCGQGAQVGESLVMTSGELGMKRWLHVRCWQAMPGHIMEDDEDDWDDYED